MRGLLQFTQKHNVFILNWEVIYLITKKKSRPSPAKLSQQKGISRDCPEDKLIVAQVKASVITETERKVIRSATHARGVKNQNLRNSSYRKPGQTRDI